MSKLYYFTKDKGIERFFADYKDTILCKAYQDKCEAFKEKGKKNPKLPGYLHKYLNFVIDTKKKVDPEVIKYIEKLENPEIIKTIHSGLWWHDVSGMTRAIMESGGINFNEKIVDTSVPIELFYFTELLFDEIIDNQHSCMYLPTLWTIQTTGKRTEDNGKWKTECIKEEVEALALSSILDIGKKYSLDKEKLSNLFDHFFKMKKSYYNGQYLDLKLQQNPYPKIEESFEMMQKIEGDIVKERIGMVSAINELDKTNNTLLKIGELIGNANKLRDDIVDIVGEPEAQGRKPGSDIIITYNGKNYSIENSKKTIPVTLTINAINKEEIKINEDDFYNKKNLLKKIVDTGIIDISKNYLNQYLNEINSLARDLKGDKNSLENLIAIFENFSV